MTFMARCLFKLKLTIPKTPIWTSSLIGFFFLFFFKYAVRGSVRNMAILFNSNVSTFGPYWDSLTQVKVFLSKHNYITSWKPGSLGRSPWSLHPPVPPPLQEPPPIRTPIYDQKFTLKLCITTIRLRLFEPYDSEARTVKRSENHKLIPIPPPLLQ